MLPFPDLPSSAPAEAALFLACAQGQGVAARILNLLDLSSSAPLERYVVLAFCACSMAAGS